MQGWIRRFIVPALLLAAGCAAAAWAWRLAGHVQSIEHASERTAARIDRVQALLDELQERELGFAGSRHLEGSSLAGVSDLLTQTVVESSLLNSQSLAAGTAAAQAVAGTAAVLGEAEARARANLSAGLEPLAADLLFSETRAHRRTLRQQLRALRTAETGAAAAARSWDLQQAWAALASVALLYAGALIRWSRPSAMAPQPISITTSEAGGAGAGPLPVSVDLPEAADLCTAIARLEAVGDLQRILDRTATLLGAPGVVLWMGAGEELFPAACSGYDLRDLSRGGPIPRAAGNATASAWRTGVMQAVAGDASSKAALVAPMLGPDRCVGALAIEVAPGREADTATRAVAAMIAAQLAAVLAAWPAPSSSPQAGVLPFDRMANAST